MIRLTREQFMRYLPVLSFCTATKAISLYDDGCESIAFSDVLIEYWNNKLNGNV